MLTLDIFGFKALWSPYFLLILLAIVAVYFLITITFRHKFSNSEPLTKKQAGLFLLSMTLFYAIKGSPLDVMAHLMFYVHMIQMATIVFVIPIIFIFGIPVWIWRKLFSIKLFNLIFKFFTRPIIALITFNGLFSFYHLPLVFDRIMPNIWLHAGYSMLLFFVAIFMWWPLMNPVPEHQTLSGLKKVGYIFADGMLLLPACALIIFSPESIYLTYSDPAVWSKAMALCVGPATFAGLDISGPELFSSMSLLHDQQLGGVLMKVVQEIIYGSVLAHVFFEWYRKDQADSENELNQTLEPSLIK